MQKTTDSTEILGCKIIIAGSRRQPIEPPRTNQPRVAMTNDTITTADKPMPTARKGCQTLGKCLQYILHSEPPSAVVQPSAQLEIMVIVGCIALLSALQYIV